MKLRVGSMFAGIGGIEKGFEMNGADLIWANEIDINASKTYKENFGHTFFLEDVKNIDISKLDNIDILTAGFPCQSFSVAGYRKSLLDERGQLFLKPLELLRH